MRKLWILASIFMLFGLGSWAAGTEDDRGDKILLGDPFIMLYDGTYYAYGTHSDNGFGVWTSDDLKSWKQAEGRAADGLVLHKDDVWGDRWFWAPEVYAIDGKFYMYYSAEEHICVAVADSPLGPFKQTLQEPMLAEKAIDNSLFIDRKGKPYLFFDRFLDSGLTIFVAELEKDLQTIKPKTVRRCIGMSQDWERVWPSVNEGSFVIERDGTYYMTYSANSYESPSYGLGYATARKVTGPWIKYADNPIFQFPGDLQGVGHSAMFTDKEGNLRVVFHAHADKTHVHPRAMYIGTVRFVERDGREVLTIDPDYIVPRLVK